MQATLLIRNIHKLYTCNDSLEVLEGAFIAMHHETILAIGTGDGQEYVHPLLTRILDVHNHIVVPAFIEPGFHPQNANLIELEKKRSRLFQNGILTLVTNNPSLQASSVFQKTLYRPERKRKYHHLFEVLDLNEDLLWTTAHDKLELAGFQPMLAHAWVQSESPEPKILLHQLTARPAKELGIPKKGVLKEGMTGDFLILNVLDFSEYMKSCGIPLIHYIVHEGIIVHPEIIRC